jgi:hypothetical protein
MQTIQDPRDSLSAASAAAKVPTPISTWTLDGTGGFNDSGPAAVNMTIVGSWTDLTTGSLVSGVGGTSACNAGTGAYATLPASQAAHNLGALTLSFYYQRNSMAAKHVLFAVGDGTAIGDLSIEVLANGLLRGYHVGGDGVLRFFESTNGITGARFPVGTARRIDVSLGAAGAQIFVDGAAYPAATIAANTNGWNNAAVKYLAVFPGPKANAVGLFDHVRLWNVQLSAAQIAALEPARSVTLVVPAPISTWTLNGTGGFADSGAADVDFTIAGTFADLTTGSMVQGGSGNSAYTDGSGTYAMLPANVAGHSLSALTLSFYYQRNSTAAKHVLFAVGDGTVAGDLSIEVLPGGLLRGYHVGVDGVLDFFESTNGVTGTSFPIGTARRIELTLGAAGVALYVDGVAYAAAAITGNTNTWNNAAVKYLGCFPGNPVQAMAIGAFDHIRLWNVQLTPAQISMLEPAVSVTLPPVEGSSSETITVAQFELKNVSLTAGAVDSVTSQPTGLTRMKGAKVYARRASETNNAVGQLMVAARGVPGDYVAQVRTTGGADVSVTVRVASDPISGTVRYVNAETGNNGSAGTSAGAAWATWTYALTNAPSGSLIVWKAAVATAATKSMTCQSLGRAMARCRPRTRRS